MLDEASCMHGAMSGKNGGRVIWPWKDTSLLGWYDLLFSRTSYSISHVFFFEGTGEAQKDLY
jgi:hypothetical protein